MKRKKRPIAIKVIYKESSEGSSESRKLRLEKVYDWIFEEVLKTMPEVTHANDNENHVDEVSNNFNALNLCENSISSSKDSMKFNDNK